MRVISETEVVLKEVRQQADIMCEKNRQAALKYVTEIRDTMKDRTKMGVEKVNRVVEENLSSIRVELLALETTTKDIFNGLVDIFQSDINEAINNLSSADDQNLTSALNTAISQAEYELNTMWNDIDQMYSYYSSYTTDLIQNKGQNITERINGLVASQKRYCDCTLYERVSMCYNISLANIETSRTIEKLVHAINNIYNATDVVDKLHYMHSDADEHALSVTNDSTSMLDKYKKDSQEMLEILIADHYCFLGSAVRHTSERTYPHIKRFILRSWRSAIQNASTGLNATLTVDPLIKEEYRHRMIDDAKESLKKLGDLIKTKASLLQDEASKNKFIEKADFVQLGYLMENRFKNVTEVINTAYTKDLWCAAEIMKYNVEFIVDQKVPFLSSITIQNYLPTDVCPLAVDFSNFIYRFLRTDLFKDPGNDILDRLLPEHEDAVYVTDETQNDDDTSAPQDSDIHISIVLFGDDSNEDEKKTISATGGATGTQIAPSDDLYIEVGHPIVQPKPFFGQESTATSYLKSDYLAADEPVSNYNVEPKPDGYDEEEPKDELKSDQGLVRPNIQPVPIEPIVGSIPAKYVNLFDSEDELKFSRQIIPSKEVQGPLDEEKKVDATTQTEEAMQQDSVTVNPSENALTEAKKAVVTSAEGLKTEGAEETTLNKSPQKLTASSEQDDVSKQSFLTDEVDTSTSSQESAKNIKEKFKGAVEKIEKMLSAADALSQSDKR